MKIEMNCIIAYHYIIWFKFLTFGIGSTIFGNHISVIYTMLTSFTMANQWNICMEFGRTSLTMHVFSKDQCIINEHFQNNWLCDFRNTYFRSSTTSVSFHYLHISNTAEKWNPKSPKTPPEAIYPPNILCIKKLESRNKIVSMGLIIKRLC